MMRRSLFITFVCLFSGFLLTTKGFAQESIGGTPPSFLNQNLTSEYQTVVLSTPSLDLIRLEDSLRDKQGFFHRVGVGVQAGYDMNNSGTWTILPDGSRIWRLKIRCTGALALGVYYERFFLPPGTELYVYSADHKQVIGAFTSANNPAEGFFATELIKGDELILEYYEPFRRIAGTADIRISEVSYVYRDAYVFRETKDFGDSDYCEVNINCSEGTNWQDEKKGVARIFLKAGSSYGWCTGTLINNVNQNCTPYFLTADHCGENSSAADFLQWVFYFNYEAAGCTNPSTQPSYNSKTGCVKRANGGSGGTNGSDFLLLEFSTAVNSAWQVYYNGWSRSTTASGSGVSIHHPAGDIKKISTYTSTLVSSSWGSAPGSHWRVQWAATTNGHGVTEGGSSGSPIFNASGLIVGDLTGGGSYCSTPSNYDYYGKFSYSWDQNGTTAATRLKDWLDPGNTNPTTLSGRGPCTAAAPVANFSASATNISVGGSVNFTDLSTNSPTSWSWSFSGGTPSSSTAQNPTNIVYNTAGTYTVTLTASNSYGSDSETKTGYIVVSSGGTGTCDTMQLPLTGTATLYGAQGGGYACGNNAYGDKAKAEYFGSYSPFNKVNGIMFWFGAAEGSGSAQAALWNHTGTQPGTTFATANLPVSQIISDVNNNYYTYVAFSTPANIPGPFYAGVILPTTAGDTIGLVSNADGQASPVNAWEQWSNNSWNNFTTAWNGNLDIRMAIFPHVCQVVTGEEEVAPQDQEIQLYPNPARDEVMIQFRDRPYAGIRISMTDILGQKVLEYVQTGDATNLIPLNVEQLRDGTYFVIIENNAGRSVKKLNLVR